MAIGRLAHLLAGHLVAMHVAVAPVVIDAQEALAVGEYTSAAVGGSLQLLCHRYSYQVNHQAETMQRLAVFVRSLKNSNPNALYSGYPIFTIVQAILFISVPGGLLPGDIVDDENLG